MAEFLWWQALLIGALFFALGWGAARIDMRHVIRARSELPRGFLEALRWLLQGNRERALEALLPVADAHPETVALQNAVAALLRERGEFERAIAIHQRLLARDALSAGERLELTAELAQDFHRAGWLDRAEAHYRALLGTERDAWARQALLAIYQVERAWEQCLALLDSAAPGSLVAAPLLATHWHCEQAVAAMAREAWDEAERHLDAAQSYGASANSVRPLLLRAEWLLAQGRSEEALPLWQEIEHRQPAALALVVPLWLSHLDASTMPQALRQLRRWLRRHPELDVWDRYVDCELAHGDAALAMRRCFWGLQAAPSLFAVAAYLRVLPAQLPSAWLPALERVRGVVEAHLARAARYRCRQCGFAARRHHWHCPACGGWETFPPIRELSASA